MKGSPGRAAVVRPAALFGILGRRRRRHKQVRVMDPLRQAAFRVHYVTLPAWPADARFAKWVRAGAVDARRTRRGVQFWVPVPNALRRAAGRPVPPGGEPEWSDIPLDAWLCRGMADAFARRHAAPSRRAAARAALLAGDEHALRQECLGLGTKEDVLFAHPAALRPPRRGA